MEEKLSGLYREIAEIIDDMIPEEWNQFHFYAQVSKSGGAVYFFYEPEESIGTYIYSIEVPYEFDIDEEVFNNNKAKLYKVSREMRDIFENEGQELWYSFTFSITVEEKMKIHFDYTDWLNTDYDYNQLLEIWEYKYLGAEPEDEESKALIEKYLEEYPDNPI